MEKIRLIVGDFCIRYASGSSILIHKFSFKDAQIQAKSSLLSLITKDSNSSVREKLRVLCVPACLS